MNLYPFTFPTFVLREKKIEILFNHHGAVKTICYFDNLFTTIDIQ